MRGIEKIIILIWIATPLFAFIDTLFLPLSFTHYLGMCIIETFLFTIGYLTGKWENEKNR